MAFGVILLIAGEASTQTQEQVRQRLITSEERLRGMEKRLELLEGKPEPQDRSGAQVTAIAEMAKMVMDSYESRFGVIKWAAVAMSAVITLVVGTFALLGFNQVREIVRPLRRGHRDLIKRVEEEQRKLSTITTNMEAQTKALDLVREEAKRNFQALQYVISSFTLIQFPDPPRDMLNKALKDVDKAITEFEPSDPKILCWAYSIRGFILRRVSGPRDGLASIEVALMHDPTNESAHFNAACYAALVGDKPKWVKHLEAAVRLNHNFRQDAITDTDFVAIRDDEDFRRITAEA